MRYMRRWVGRNEAIKVQVKIKLMTNRCVFPYDESKEFVSKNFWDKIHLDGRGHDGAATVQRNSLGRQLVEHKNLWAVCPAEDVHIYRSELLQKQWTVRVHSSGRLKHSTCHTSLRKWRKPDNLRWSEVVKKLRNLQPQEQRSSSFNPNGSVAKWDSKTCKTAIARKASNVKLAWML